ncbi:MAG: hypothetical protein L3K00_09020 [Thermoplasmata archaeon]|nr:hypothetical protein [Thermoplasmata archaeon]
MTVEHRAPSPAHAAALWASVAADNPSFVDGGVDGDLLRFHVHAPNAASLRQTLDDLLAALGVAERAAAPTRSSPP